MRRVASEQVVQYVYQAGYRIIADRHSNDIINCILTDYKRVLTLANQIIRFWYTSGQHSDVSECVIFFQRNANIKPTVRTRRSEGGVDMDYLLRFY